MDITNIRLAKQFLNVYLDNKGALGMLSPKQAQNGGGIPLTPDERLRIEKEYQQQYGIKKGQSKILIAQTSLDWTSMTHKVKEMMLFEGIEEGSKRIIDFYGMNINIFSTSKSNTYENLKEGLKQVYTGTIIPDAEAKAMILSKRFGLVEQSEHLELDYSGISILQENEKEKSEVLKNKVESIAKLKETGIYSDKELLDIIQL